MVNVRFLASGTWAEARPRDPQITVTAGDTRVVSYVLADSLIKAGKAERVLEEAAPVRQYAPKKSKKKKTKSRRTGS